MAEIEIHPFKPFLPQEAKIVMCGTFPPKKEKWAMEFFYPNFINDMWRIYGYIFYNDKNYFVDMENKRILKDEIEAFLRTKGIAISETVKKAIRTKGNASDKYLDVVGTVNLQELFSKLPYCNHIVSTGEKAAGIIASLTDTDIPKIGDNKSFEIMTTNGENRRIAHWRMPSTSRAYPLKLEKKAEFYRTMLKNTGILI